MKDNTNDFVRSFIIFENNDYDIILIENYPCNNKDELKAQERHYIETLKCVNKNIPGRTLVEYYKDNRDMLLEKKKKYDLENKDKIKQYYESRKEFLFLKNECPCGGKFATKHKNTHLKTVKHLKWLDQQNVDIVDAINL